MWKYNIKMAIRQIGCENVNWIELAADRDKWWSVLNTEMNLGSMNDGIN
jgi:hypothetical protein